MNWQPIKTAPKNEDVLVCCVHGMYVARFQDDATDEWHDEGAGESDFDQSWTITDNRNGPYRLRGGLPSHWMPLPNRPEPQP